MKTLDTIDANRESSDLSVKSTLTRPGQYSAENGQQEEV